MLFIVNEQIYPHHRQADDNDRIVVSIKNLIKLKQKLSHTSEREREKGETICCLIDKVHSGHEINFL